MTLQFSAAVRNAQLEAIEATVGVSAQLLLYSGAEPANCSSTATGTLLATIALPSDWMANAATGAKVKQGTWSGSASAAGTAGYYRIYDNGIVNCHVQGSVGATSSGADMEMDNPVIATAQVITVNTYSLAAANA